MKRENKRSSFKLQEFKYIRELLFERKKDDIGFIEYVVLMLGFHNVEEFMKYGDKSCLKKCGRPIK